MTEMTSTALTVPSNIYDPSLETFTERAHEQIHHDLSSIGKVYRIVGSIMVTTKHGIRFDHVYAYVENHFLALPVLMEVRWDENEKRIRYFTQNQSYVGNNSSEFVPLVGTYGPDILSGREREVVDTLFERILSHPAVSWRDDYHRLKPSSSKLLTWGGVGATMSGGAVSGALMAADVLGPAALLSIPVVGVGSYLTNRKAHSEFNAAYKIHCAAAGWWNTHRKEVIPELLGSQADLTVFMDALLTLCDAHDIAYQGDLKVSNTMSISRHTAPLRQDEGFHSNGNYYGESGLRWAMVSFVARLPQYSQLQYVFFDGKHLYHFKSGDHKTKRVSTIVPLSTKDHGVDYQAMVDYEATQREYEESKNRLREIKSAYRELRSFVGS